MLTAEQIGTIQWDKANKHYMLKHDTPRWRVDTANDSSCFYDNKGAHQRTSEYTAMYDYTNWQQSLI